MSKNIFGSYNTGIVSATGSPFISSDAIMESDSGITLSSALDSLQAGNFSGNLTIGDASSDTITVNAGTTTNVNNEILNLKNSSTAGLTVKASGGSTFITLDTNSTGTLNLYNNVVCNGGLTTQSIVQMNGSEIAMNESMVIYTKPDTINAFKISTTETVNNMVSAHDMLIIHSTQGAEKIYLPMAGELLNVAMDSQIGDATYANKMDIYGKVAVKNATDSTSSITGGIVIAGGCAISKKLYVGDAIVGASSLSCGSVVSSGAISGTTITGTGALTVSTNSITCGAINNSGIMTSTNVTDSSSYSTGSVIISGGVGISKHMYLLGGLYLATTGGTPSVLNYYESGVSFSVLFKSTGGGGTTNTVTVKLSRIGNIVNMIVPNMSIDTNGGYIISDATTFLPSRFQPVNTYSDFPCHTVNLGVYLDTGIFTVCSSGQILIYKAQGGSIYFGVGAGSGITNVSSFTWQV